MIATDCNPGAFKKFAWLSRLTFLRRVFGKRVLSLLDRSLESFPDEAQSPNRCLIRYLAAFSIWFYPVFYGIALLISLLAFWKKKSLSVITLPALLPLIPPLYLFAFWVCGVRKGETHKDKVGRANGVIATVIETHEHKGRFPRALAVNRP